MGRKIFFLILVILAGGGFFFFRKDSNPSPLPTPTRIEEALPVNFEASFEIYTYGTKRIFSDPKYHNKSADVYLEASNPEVVYVRADRVTWADLFNSLPMKLTRDCLTTGTGQVFCQSGGGKLGFFVNDEEFSDALEKEIRPGDHLLVTYK